MYRHTYTHIFRCTHIGVQLFARRGRQELSCRVSCVQAVVLNLFPSLLFIVDTVSTMYEMYVSHSHPQSQSPTVTVTLQCSSVAV